MLNATKNTPYRFSHDCEDCHFVGRAFDGEHDADVWLCPNHKELIIRFSGRPDHYMARALRDFGQVFGDIKLWGIAHEVFRGWQRRMADL